MAVPAPASAAAESGAKSGSYVVPVERIRNFCIIAHIDHGKSTLADRLIQLTGTVADRDMKEQLLDNMDIERERGITIKLQAARMVYKANDGLEYILNLIDTPGHVDFGYEVARSLQACEGALLVVDASQGVEAQTIANVFLALEQNLELIPILNKVDLPAADVDRTAQEVEACIGLDCTDAIPCSAKSGLGIAPILEAIVKRIPAPKPTRDKPLRALVFDSYYDPYRGVVVFVRIVDGEVRKGDKLRFMATKYETDCLEVGVMSPAQRPVDVLSGGEVGYITGAIKSITEARVGDTITLAKYAQDESVQPLPGYREPVPMVYCGLYPTEGDDYPKLRDSIAKLKTNDAALVFEPDVSSAMGFGFRCGFLGLLHMEIVQERLEREYDLDLIVTAPSVVYKVNTTRGEEVIVDTPSRMPEPTLIQSVSEPYVALEVLSPKDYSGTLMELCQNRRGEYKDLTFVTAERISLKYEMPLSEVITDFFDEVKSRTKGYASIEYKQIGYRPNKLVKLDVMINSEIATPLACIVHESNAHEFGKRLTRALKELIPRQQFKVPIQACIGAKVVASSTINALRKDVLAKCYGGDISRKKKLLNKQAKGKKRMKTMGKVNVPQEAFMAVLNLKAGDDSSD